MKVGILTLPISNNYGGMLQAAALYRIIQDMGHEPVLLAKKFWRPMSQKLIAQILRAIPGHDIRSTRSIERARARHYPFLDSFIPNRVGPIHTKAALERAIRTCRLDAVIVGSDQVWRPSYIEDIDTGSYFLDIDGPFRKISYAASFGKSEWTAPHRLGDVRRMLADFDAVSLRETSGVALCQNVLNRADCELTLDPTMLVAAEFYEDLIADVPPQQPHVLNYSLDGSELANAALQKVLEGPARGRVVKKLTLDDGEETSDIAAWVRAFKDAEFVVTDSFHGTVFSILFGKPFVAIGNAERGVDRFTSLLALLGLSDRLVLRADDLAVLNNPVPYDAVAPRLTALRAASTQFLNRALAPEGASAHV